MLLKFNVTTAAAVDSRLRLGKRTFFCNPQSATGSSGRNSEEPHTEKNCYKARIPGSLLAAAQCRCNTTRRGRQSKAASHKYVM
jgi:hypothetical protein